MFNKKFINKIKLYYSSMKRHTCRQAGMTHSIFSQDHSKYSRGMTYIELIVVLSIFATMSSIVMFNYGSFQAKIDIKNLASDIALKIIQAQKYSVSGKLPSAAQQIIIEGMAGGINSWKPSYGLNFKTTDSKIFIYFTDINTDRVYNSADGELIEAISINKGNSITRLEVFDVSNISCSTPNEINITFERPNSGAIISPIFSVSGCVTSYVDITVSSASGSATSKIRVYTSGRIEIK